MCVEALAAAGPAPIGSDASTCQPPARRQDEEDGGDSYQLIVWSEKAVVAAGGSIHTPALLLRSKLKHPKIGRHLALVRFPLPFPVVDPFE